MRTHSFDGSRPLSVVGLGTWQFGSTEWGYGEDYAWREAGAIVRRALDLGVTLIDSAEGYGHGRDAPTAGRWSGG